MPPTQIIDLNTIDITKVLYDAAEIEKVNPHRYEMRQLDAVIHADVENAICVGYKDITDQEFWVRGHIPGRPIMPGVIMIEAAAQLSSFQVLKVVGQEAKSFVGFGGITDVKFRGTVTPGDRLFLISKIIENRPRRFICNCQGVVKDQMVLQAQITGMPI